MPDTDAKRVDPTNADALQAWDGPDGDYWTEHEATFDRAVAGHHGPFLEAAAIQPDDRVLDVGCGTGQASRDAARRAPGGSVLGVDLSSRMIELARRRAVDEGLTNVAFEQVDAQVHPFDQGAFDVAISRTGAMFFGNPAAAFANIARALRPGGRLCLLVWQGVEPNHWIRDFRDALAAGRELPMPPPDAPGPFSLADPDRTRSILDAAGFADVGLAESQAPMWFGEDAETAFAFQRGMGITDFLLEGLDETARAGALKALRATIEAHETPEGVLYPSATWIVTARRATGSAPAPRRG